MKKPITIQINEEEQLLSGDLRIQDVKEKYDPEADVVIYNGFPVCDYSILLQNQDTLYFIKRGRKLTREELERVITSRHTPGVAEILKKSSVGVAGLGGLGSHIALSLVRIGIGKLVLVDFDVVEPSNLNRQQYFIEQLGMYKTEALSDTLHRVNPYTQLILHTQKVSEENVQSFFSDCDIVIEAFDRAEEKTMLIKECARLCKTVIAASGLAGYGENDSIVTQKINERFYLIGDSHNEACPGRGLMAPRVMIAAGKEANLAVELLLSKERKV